MSKSIYDIEFDDSDFLNSSGLESLLWLKSIKDRKIYVNYEIDESLIENVVTPILQFNMEDKGVPVEERKPIYIYINSPGGDVDHGFAAIDAITASKTPVYTVNLGENYSMAFLIGLAGHKRYAMHSAKYLMHDGTSLVWDSGMKAQDRVDFNKKVDERIKEFVLAHSRLTAKEYARKERVEWYMFADEAKRYGMVDFIIGEDCGLDEVI